MDRIGRDNAEQDGALDCEQWEAILADKMDQSATGQAGALSPEAEAAFTAHSLRCPGCGQLMEQARQGELWLQMLKDAKPAPPVDLLGKILAKTRGAGAEADFPLGTAALAGVQGDTAVGRWGMPFPTSLSLLAMRRAHHARLLMTAAMALFSVALTLSVAGVKITSVHAAELRPQAMQANVTRSFYGTKKQIVSFYENLRLVYEVESKMQDLRRDVEPTSTPEPQQKPLMTKPAPKAKGSAVVTPGSSSNDKPAQVVRGWPELVSYPAAPCTTNRQAGNKTRTTLIPGALRTERNRI